MCRYRKERGVGGRVGWDSQGYGRGGVGAGVWLQVITLLSLSRCLKVRRVPFTRPIPITATRVTHSAVFTRKDIDQKLSTILYVTVQTFGNI